MKVEHLAIWVGDLEAIKSFYVKYFGAIASDLYHNPKKNFKSYFLTFADGDTRLELMQQPDHHQRQEAWQQEWDLHAWDRELDIVVGSAAPTPDL